MDLIIPVYSYDSDEIDREVLDCDEEKRIKVCRYCGKKFVAKGRNYWRCNTCNRVHYSICSVCGSEFDQSKAISIGTKLSEVCSNRQCINTLSGRKSKLAIQKKYGVDNSFQLEEVKAKSKQTCLEKYGVPYAMQSDEIKHRLVESLALRTEEQKAEVISQRKQTCIEKYGVDNPLKVPAFRDKSKQTCLERYGVEFVSQSAEFKESVARTWANKTEVELDLILQKRIATCKQVYGVEFACQHPDILKKLIQSLVNKSVEEKADIRQRTVQTCLERYGATSPAGNDDVQAKMRKSTFEKYGVEYIFQLPEFREYLRQWTLEHFGVENPLQSEELREKGKQTSIARYGVPYPNQSPELRKQISKTRIQHYADAIEDPILRANYLLFKEDPIQYVLTQFDHMPTYDEVSRSIGNVNSSTIYSNIPTSLGLLDQSISSMESQVRDALNSIDPEIQIWFHDRDTISPLELDIYLPEYKIAIECNPTYTHNSSIPSYGNKEPLSTSYHNNKSNLCEQKGIFLFHIFGYEWTHNKDVIVSMLRNLLGKVERKFYARNLNIVELSGDESKVFLDMNHRQRGVYSKIRLGLKTKEGELISCMTFSKTRSSIGKLKDEDSDCYELVRFCNKLDTSVVGGASKLFKYFIRNYEPSKIISFSDRAHTRGKLYEILGFTKVSISDPGYVWVKSKDDTWYNRVSCQKQNLPKLFNEPNLDIKNQTEQQIMVSHGFVQVFDSGVIRWEYLGK